MTAERRRLTEGSSANVLALLSGTHDSKGHWAGPWSQGGRYPSTSGITFPQWAWRKSGGLSTWGMRPFWTGSTPLSLPQASWETASAWVATRALGPKLSFGLQSHLGCPNPGTWPALRASEEMEEQNQGLTNQVLVKGTRTKPSSELN